MWALFPWVGGAVVGGGLALWFSDQVENVVKWLAIIGALFLLWRYFLKGRASV